MEPPHDMREGLGPAPEAVRRVLAVRPGGLSSMVRAVPALRHLRSVYPEAQITVAVEERARELLTACPYADETIALADAADARTDLVVVLARPHEAAGIELPAVSDSRMVAYRPAGSPQDRGLRPAAPERLDEAHTMLRLVWLLGGDRPRTQLSLWPTLAERNAAAQLVEVVDRPIALVHPGASARERRWPAAGFGRIVDILVEAGMAVVLVGTRDERELARRVRAASSAACMNLVGRTSVGVLAGLMERASLLVGNDSGPAALAVALHLPAVVIGPASRVEQAGHAGSVTYVTPQLCPTCGEAASCEHPLPPAAQTSAEAVFAEVTLAAERARSAWQRQRLADA